MKILRDEQASEIEGLVDSLSPTSNDAEALQENSRMLEASVARYEAEIQKKDEIRQNLETQAKEKELFIAQISADLQTAEKSVEDMRIQLVEANKKAVDAESVNERSKTNLSSQEGAVQQYQNDLTTVQGQFADAQAEIIEWGMKHADYTKVLSSIISGLRDDTLATANGDIERSTLRLHVQDDMFLKATWTCLWSVNKCGYPLGPGVPCVLYKFQLQAANDSMTMLKSKKAENPPTSWGHPMWRTSGERALVTSFLSWGPLCDCTKTAGRQQEAWMDFKVEKLDSVTWLCTWLD